MILFFGTRPGKSTLKKLLHVSCPFCEQTGTLTVSQTSNYAHLFWIKLFKITRHTVAKCEHCKRVYYKEEFTEQMLRAIAE